MTGVAAGSHLFFWERIMTGPDGVEQLARMQIPSTGLQGAGLTTVTSLGGRQAVSRGGNAAPPAANAESKDRHMVVIEAANKIASLVQNVSRELRFSVDEGTGRTVLTVTDRNTEQIIRQIPGEEVLELAERLMDADSQDQRGILLNKEA
jgi:flagellar protein FlaG